MIGVPLVYRLHILLGFTIFLISPFTRMVHIWSGAGALAYLFRPYQIVRTPRTRAQVAGAVMSVTVNGVAVDAGRWPSPEVAAVRELLRQRAVARGLLVADATDDKEISDGHRAPARAKRSQVPTPTEAECRRYYETHPQGVSTAATSSTRGTSCSR